MAGWSFSTSGWKNRQSFIDLYCFLVIMQKAVTAIPKNHFPYHHDYITTSL